MGITAQEDELFERWRKRRADLVADGVVDEHAYLQSDPKLMFVLKEVNDPEGGNWDLREFLLGDSRSATWDNVTRWALSIRSLADDIPWDELSSISPQQRTDTLRSLCVVNLKKSPGGHTTNIEEFYAVVGRDRDFLTEQFGLYENDLIICCGTPVSELVMTQVINEPNSAWSTTTRGIRYYRPEDGSLMIGFAHPEARVQDSILNYALADALREVWL